MKCTGLNIFAVIEHLKIFIVVWLVFQ